MKQYQPIEFHPSVRAIFTTAHDGTIATGAGKPDKDEHVKRRHDIINHYFGVSQHTKLLIKYDDTQTYTHIERLADTSLQEIHADAVYTTLPQAVLALPVADCIATLVHDPVTNMMAILHLGRHSSVAGLIESFVIEAADNLGSDPRDWYVWMSPSLTKDHDRMDYFTPPHLEEWEGFTSQQSDGIYIDIPGHNAQRFMRAGVPAERIYTSPEDTYSDKRFFSQRAADEQKDTTRQGRMMLAASLLRDKQVS